MINYFNFKRFGDKFLLTNDLGRYIFASKIQLNSLVKNEVDYNSDFGKEAEENFFCFDGSTQAFSGKMRDYMRESKSYLFSATSLHIFVVTNACNLKCKYCQAKSGNAQNGFMNRETAQKAVDIALSSPAEYLSFEFQGGEPLLNFKTVKYIVRYAEEHKQNKKIEYSIVTNLTKMNDEIADFIKTYGISVSTSLDGDDVLHNENRPYRSGKGTYLDVLSGIEHLKRYSIKYGAIQTTTAAALSKAKQLIDTYVDLGLDNIFIRSLTPLGCAYSEWQQIGYTPEEFIKFYKECFDYLLELNLNGTFIKEGHASIFLSKILNGVSLNYMELRSPCGAGIGQIAYYYDGNVYTCDEGRMLAEMGDEAFKLGTVDDSYETLIDTSTCKAVCLSSFLESLPNCCECVYQPYCGTCPVVNLALQKDIFNKEPNDYKCRIYRGMLDILFEALCDESKKEVLKSWVN